MTTLQKLQIKQSSIREKINSLLGLEHEPRIRMQSS